MSGADADINEAASVTSSAAFSSAENTTDVATLAATDPDLPAQLLTWSIAGGADAAVAPGAIHGAGDGHAGADACRRQARQQGHVAPVVAGDRAMSPLAAWRAGVPPAQRGVGARLIDKDHLCRIEGGDRRPPDGTGGGVLLGGDQTLFLRGWSIRWRVRHMVASLTCTPVAAAKAAQCSRKVASGRAVT